MTTDFEKLGQFYLGRPYDLTTKKGSDVPLLYDSKDLVTHAVCVGMTGSGKTGLCLALLEEAAIDGIPSILIDPKGDLANLLLTFPELTPEQFRPWINGDDAKRKNLTPDEFAAQQAETWKKGLESWGQTGERIKLLKNSADFAIYTPGSNAGLPVAILKSFACPNPSVMEDDELLQELIRTTATSVLGLVGVDADPVQSREHILISTLLNLSWKAGKDIDLGGLIGQVQNPPVERIGVLDVESFFNQKDRFSLAMKLNNLLAAPGFENWLNGEALDIGKILYTPKGTPRVAIFSIAHLSDAERMFFVSLLLNQLLGWTRAQSGTTSLRAILYMDEIFGYFPPVQNPPSKLPLLTLLKQARAFGVGCVLATQNPVDLDYKGLANCGTWFIGRLQTERDKMRVLDGLEGAAAGQSTGFERSKMEEILAGLGNRVFLMNNVKENAPIVFESRWVLSYLRGPLTRSQIKQLMDERKSKLPADVAPTAPVDVTKRASAPTARKNAVAPANPASSDDAPIPAPVKNARLGRQRPVLPPDIKQLFIPIRSSAPAGATLVYQPVALGLASIYFNDTKSGLHATNDVCLIAPLQSGPVTLDWQNATESDLAEADLLQQPEGDAPTYESLPVSATQSKSYDGFRKSLVETLYRTATLSLMRSQTTGELSKPRELERDFRIRLSQSLREVRDAEVDKIKQKYAPKQATLQDRVRRAQLAEQEQQRQATASKMQTVISFGATILGAFLGRKAVSAGTIGKATTAARGVTRSMKESQDVGRAEENVQGIQRQLDDLDAQLKSELDGLSAKYDASTEKLDTIEMRPRKSDITVKIVALAWQPAWQTPEGNKPA